jgi:hypothetical protein
MELLGAQDLLLEVGEADEADVIAAGPQPHPGQRQDRGGNQRKDREHQNHDHRRHDEQMPGLAIEPFRKDRRHRAPCVDAAGGVGHETDGL